MIPPLRYRNSPMLTIEKPSHAAAELLDEQALVAELEKLADKHGGVRGLFDREHGLFR